MAVDGSFSLFFIIITIINSDKQQDVPRIISDLSFFLQNATEFHVVYAFKLTGEARLAVIANATDGAINFIEDAASHVVGSVQLDTQPVIPYESFAVNLGVTNCTLTEPTPSGFLGSGGLYWFNFKVDFFGKSVRDLLDIWKAEAIAVLSDRAEGKLQAVLYKNLAEREVQFFGNIRDPQSFDFGVFSLPIYAGLGSYINIQSEKVQLLSDYLQDNILYS